MNINILWENDIIFHEGELYGETWYILEYYELKEYCKKQGIDDPEEWVESIIGTNYGYTEDFYICDNCGAIIPMNEYGKPNYWVNYEYGCIFCNDCIESDESVQNDYIDGLCNNPDSANIILQLENHGFQKMSEIYENGWYGRTDKPSEILEKYRENYPEMEFIFSMEYVNPFMVEFSIWGRDVK